MKILILEYENRNGQIRFCPSLPQNQITINLPANVNFIVIEKQKRNNNTVYQIFGTDERSDME